MGEHLQLSEITDEYLRVLGLERTTPDLAFLNEIIRRHVDQLPFSSVGPMLGDPLPLDIESLYRRIVTGNRGGYCFEHNGLLYDILRELGFSVSLFLARVIYNEDIHPGLTHRITLAEIGTNQYVVDAGFGPLGPAAAINMSGQLMKEAHRAFRVIRARGGAFHMQTLKDGGYYSLYKFELNRYGQADCEVGHFYSHQHPKASFVNNLVVSRIMDNETRSLRNRDFQIITEGAVRKISVDDAIQLMSVLDEQFNLKVTETECEQLFIKTARNNAE